LLVSIIAFVNNIHVIICVPENTIFSKFCTDFCMEVINICITCNKVVLSAKAEGAQFRTFRKVIYVYKSGTAGVPVWTLVGLQKVWRRDYSFRHSEISTVCGLPDNFQSLLRKTDRFVSL
jgi:hypothetical protein